MTRYTIQRGDTLTRIASRFNISVEAIARENNIKDVDYIRTGDVLNIPVGVSNDSAAIEKEETEIKLADAIKKCMIALENLPEYKQLEKLLDKMEE